MKKLGLTSKILLALLLGSICGVIINLTSLDKNTLVNTYLINGLFYLAGSGFIRLMQMLVVPLVFTSLVCGAMAICDTKKLGSVGLKTIIFYLFTTALAITLALSIASVINPGVGLDLKKVKVDQDITSIKKNKFYKYFTKYNTC